MRFRGGEGELSGLDCHAFEMTSRGEATRFSVLPRAVLSFPQNNKKLQVTVKRPRGPLPGTAKFGNFSLNGIQNSEMGQENMEKPSRGVDVREKNKEIRHVNDRVGKEI